MGHSNGIGTCCANASGRFCGPVCALLVWWLLVGCGTEFGVRPSQHVEPQQVERLFGKADTPTFDWSGGCKAGAGAFARALQKNQLVTVGVVPHNKKDVTIKLQAAADLDIQLLDANGKKLVHWPDGLLSGPSAESVSYNGVQITWSGYNGDGNGPGSEYITIVGETKNSFIMRAFGYATGTGTVDYGFDSGTRCSGGFIRVLQKDQRTVVGEIKQGIGDLAVKLQSSVDTDIELYSAGTKLVGWPDGVLSGPTPQSTTLLGTKLTWSGYNGDGTGKGNEYIRVDGSTPVSLQLKAFGYAAGEAVVSYSWDDSSVTVAQILQTPSAFSNQRVTVVGFVESLPGACTERACAPPTGCCNTCRAEQRLFDVAGSSWGLNDGLALEENGKLHACVGTECTYLNNCSLNSGKYEVVGKVIVGQWSTILRVEQLKPL